MLIKTRSFNPVFLSNFPAAYANIVYVGKCFITVWLYFCSRHLTEFKNYADFGYKWELPFIFWALYVLQSA